VCSPSSFISTLVQSWKSCSRKPWSCSLAAFTSLFLRARVRDCWLLSRTPCRDHSRHTAALRLALQPAAPAGGSGLTPAVIMRWSASSRRAEVGTESETVDPLGTSSPEPSDDIVVVVQGVPVVHQAEEKCSGSGGGGAAVVTAAPERCGQLPPALAAEMAKHGLTKQDQCQLFQREGVTTVDRFKGLRDDSYPTDIDIGARREAKRQIDQAAAQARHDEASRPARERHAAACLEQVRQALLQAGLTDTTQVAAILGELKNHTTPVGLMCPMCPGSAPGGEHPMNPAWLHQGDYTKVDTGDYTKVVTRIQKNCDVCSMRGTAYRCARGCDYDVCQSCGWEVNKAVLSTPDLAPGLDALRRLAEDRGALEALGVGAYDGQQLRAVCRSGRVGPQLEALPPVEVVLTEPQRQKAEAADAAWLLAARRLKLSVSLLLCGMVVQEVGLWSFGGATGGSQGLQRLHTFVGGGVLELIGAVSFSCVPGHSKEWSSCMRSSGITCLLVFWISQPVRFQHRRGLADPDVALLGYLAYFVSLGCLLGLPYVEYGAMRRSACPTKCPRMKGA
jgi:hypothetical protein